MTSDTKNLLKNVAVWVLRICIGAVFVVSGLVKMIDPWGFLFKIEEYLWVWNVHQPRTVELAMALVISGYEFVLGALMALGCYKRTAPIGLLLQMAVMLPLTLYIWVANPVEDCGCFGDFLVLSNAATFFKNVVISAGLVLILCWNKHARSGLFSPAIQWLIGAWLTLYIIIIGLYGYNVQPMLDFRAYAPGTSLVEHGDADEDVTGDILFVYEKDGESREFSIDELPDSTWTFVDRIVKGGTEERHTGFPIFDGDTEVSDMVMPDTGKALLLVIPELVRADVAYSYPINEIYEHADSMGIPMVALLGADSIGINRWIDYSMAEYPCYSADDTDLKALARGLISLVILQDGVVESKTSLKSVSMQVLEDPDSDEAFLDELHGYGSDWFVFVTLIFALGLLAMYVFQRLIVAITSKIRANYRKRHAKIA